MMLAGATVAGFTAACVAVPSKEQLAINRLAKLEAALRPPPEKHQETNGKKTEKKGLVAIVVAELIRAATGVAMSMMKPPATGPGVAPDAYASGSNGGPSDQASSI